MRGIFKFGRGFFKSFREGFLILFKLVFVLLSSESFSDSIALIMDLETVPRKP